MMSPPCSIPAGFQPACRGSRPAAGHDPAAAGFQHQRLCRQRARRPLHGPRPERARCSSAPAARARSMRCWTATATTGRTQVITIASGLEHAQRRGLPRRRAVRGRDQPHPALRRHRGPPAQPAEAGGRQRAAFPATPTTAGSSSASGRTACSTSRSARPATSANPSDPLRRDHAHEARRQRAGDVRPRHPQHRGLRLAPGNRRAVVHRQRPRQAGRRHARRTN